MISANLELKFSQLLKNLVTYQALPIADFFQLGKILHKS